MLHQDDFSDYKAGLQGEPQWLPVRGNWAVQDGMLQQTNPSVSSGFILLTNHTFEAVSASIRFRILSAGNDVGGAGLVVACQNPAQYYYVQFESRARQVLLVRYNQSRGFSHILVKVPNVDISLDEWHTARLERKGVRLAAYLNDKLIAEAKDDHFSTGAVGLITCEGAVQFDDLKVEGKTSTVAWSKDLPNDRHCRRLENLERSFAPGMFPVHIQLQDGSLAAVVRGGAAHIGIKGNLQLIRSTDGGKTWSEPAMIVDSEWDDRNPAFGQMPDGKLVCAYIEYRLYDDQGRYLPNKENGVVPFFVTSSDGGKTWSKKQPLFFGPILNGSPYGKIVVTKDGTALMAIYGVEGPIYKVEDTIAGIIRSRDNGKTWEDFSRIAQKHNETALLPVDEKHLVAAARSATGDAIDIVHSDDNGRSWNEPVAVTDRLQLPGDLIRLASGNILLAFGNRREPFGCAAMLSYDGGRTFDYQNRLLIGWDSLNGDCGYPSSVQLSDGMIVTLWYSTQLKDSPSNDRRINVVRYLEDMVRPSNPR